MQRNLNHHEGNCYRGDAEEKLASVQKARGYQTGIWVTIDQIRNIKGKYLYRNLALKEGAIPVTITKLSHETGEEIETRLYNLEQTNFPEVYPAMWRCLSEHSMTTEEAVQHLLSEGGMMERAMETGKQTPKNFWKCIAAFI